MTQAEKDNQNALKHGGAAARKALTTGAEFTGLAREIEKQTQKDYEVDGGLELLKRDLVRVHTTGELYWSALLGAAEAGNFAQFESYAKTYGWLAQAGARLIGQIRSLEAGHHPGDAAKVLDAYRE